MSTPEVKPLTVPQMNALRVLCEAETYDWHGVTRTRARYPMEVARILWPDSRGWKVRSNRGSTAAGGALGATMPMKAAVLLWRLERRGCARHDQHNQWFATSLGRDVLAGNAVPLPAPHDPRQQYRSGGPKPPMGRRKDGR